MRNFKNNEEYFSEMRKEILMMVIVVAFLLSCTTKNAVNYDSFAQCLTDNDVKMFGAYWCPHCQNQKDMFGDSFKFVNYVECSLPNKGGQTTTCNDAGIRGYPTWELKNGTRIEGEVSFKRLSEMTGCNADGTNP